MSQTNAQRPLTVLQKSTGKTVTVRLKNEAEYKGRMNSVDMYMNLIMSDTEELRDGRVAERYGRVILRGNNVLYVRLEDDL